MLRPTGILLAFIFILNFGQAQNTSTDNAPPKKHGFLKLLGKVANVVVNTAATTVSNSLTGTSTANSNSINPHTGNYGNNNTSSISPTNNNYGNNSTPSISPRDNNYTNSNNNPSNTKQTSQYNSDWSTPVQQVSKPVENWSKPVAEMSKPVDNFTTPQQVSKPVENWSKPVAEMSKPVDNFTTPQQVSKPVENWSKPVAEMSKPVDNFTTPQQVSKPVENWSKPVAEMSKPVDNFTTPQQVSKPVENWSKPVVQSHPVELSKPVDNFTTPQQGSKPVEDWSKPVVQISAPTKLSKTIGLNNVIQLTNNSRAIKSTLSNSENNLDGIIDITKKIAEGRWVGTGYVQDANNWYQQQYNNSVVAHNTNNWYLVGVGITSIWTPSTYQKTLGAFMLGDLPFMEASGTMKAANLVKEPNIINAVWSQSTFSSAFDSKGIFAGQTVNDVVGLLKSSILSPADVPIDVIVRDGQTFILNTRSSAALTQAGIPRSAWSVVNRTGDAFYEDNLNKQLIRNGLITGTNVIKLKNGNVILSH